MLWDLSGHGRPGLRLTLWSGPPSLSLEKPSSASLQLRLVSRLVDWPSVFMNGLIVGARNILHTSGSSTFNTTVTVPTKTSPANGERGRPRWCVTERCEEMASRLRSSRYGPCLAFPHPSCFCTPLLPTHKHAIDVPGPLPPTPLVAAKPHELGAGPWMDRPLPSPIPLLWVVGKRPRFLDFFLNKKDSTRKRIYID